MGTKFFVVIVAFATMVPAAFSQNTDSAPQDDRVAGAATHNSSSQGGEAEGKPQGNANHELDAKTKQFNERYKAIMRKQVSTRNGLIAQLRTNKDNPEKLKEIERTMDENEMEAAKSALELIETTDDEVLKIRVLVWGVRGLDGEARTIMNKRLMEDYRDSDEILPLSRVVLSRATPTHEAMIRQLINDSKNRKVKGMMTYTLAVYLNSLKDLSESSRQMAMNSLGKESSYITQRSELELSKEIEQLLETCINDFDDVEVVDRKVSELAAGMIFAATELAVGRAAPEIEGNDLDGKSFKLSDYRGKVVVVEFWGDWCVACKMRYPHQKSLVEQLADKPFALIGVNSDTDLEQIRKIVEENKLNWRSFWNGKKGYHGPISTKWDVRGWPMTYIIDANGIIRFRNILGDNMDKAIEMLLAEMGEEVKITHEFKKKEEEARKKRVEQLKAYREKAAAEKEAAGKAKSEMKEQEKSKPADDRKGK